LQKSEEVRKLRRFSLAFGVQARIDSNKNPDPRVPAPLYKTERNVFPAQAVELADLLRGLLACRNSGKTRQNQSPQVQVEI
jgi:hypothetical protein